MMIIMVFYCCSENEKQLYCTPNFFDSFMFSLMAFNYEKRCGCGAELAPQLNNKKTTLENCYQIFIGCKST